MPTNIPTWVDYLNQSALDWWRVTHAPQPAQVVPGGGVILPAGSTYVPPAATQGGLNVLLIALVGVALVVWATK